MKCFPLVFLFFFAVGCASEDTSESNPVISNGDSTASNQENKLYTVRKQEDFYFLNFSVYNATDIPVTDILVNIGAPNDLKYDSLGPKERTEWMKVKSAYEYCYVKLKDPNGQKFKFMPIDFAGAQLHKKGYLTYIIDSLIPKKGMDGWIDLDYSYELVLPLDSLYPFDKTYWLEKEASQD